MRLMSSCHRPINEKWVIFVLGSVYEVYYVVAKYIFSVLVLRIFHESTIFIDDGILIPGALFFGLMWMPYTELIESGILYFLSFISHFRYFVRGVIRI